jgi:hypothetical protein
MLVVIAIIAILAAMLAPALMTARQKSMDTACLNNHKQIGYANMLYANDYQGVFPRLGKKWDATWGAAPVDAVAWEFALWDYLGSGSALPAATRFNLNSVAAEAIGLAMYRCPLGMISGHSQSPAWESTNSVNPPKRNAIHYAIPYRSTSGTFAPQNFQSVYPRADCANLRDQIDASSTDNLLTERVPPSRSARLVDQHWWRSQGNSAGVVWTQIRLGDVNWNSYHGRGLKVGVSFYDGSGKFLDTNGALNASRLYRAKYYFALERSK